MVSQHYVNRFHDCQMLIFLIRRKQECIVITEPMVSSTPSPTIHKY